jgi:hypothetical protein
MCSTKLEWRPGRDRGWWVERIAYMSLDDWASLAATRRAIEDELAERAPTAPAVFEPL